MKFDFQRWIYSGEGSLVFYLFLAVVFLACLSWILITFL